eukprot:gene9459-biopygen4604
MVGTCSVSSQNECRGADSVVPAIAAMEPVGTLLAAAGDTREPPGADTAASLHDAGCDDSSSPTETCRRCWERSPRLVGAGWGHLDRFY